MTPGSDTNINLAFINFIIFNMHMCDVFSFLFLLYNKDSVVIKHVNFVLKTVVMQLALYS